MILHFRNGSAFVWNVDDWLQLRNWRIVGNLFGSLAHLPRQDTFPGLPLALLPEETTLLLEKGICTLKDFTSSFYGFTAEQEGMYHQFRDKSCKEQEEILQNNRKHEIEESIDRIVEGKKAKLLGNTVSKRKLRKLQKREPYVEETGSLIKAIENSKTSIVISMEDETATYEQIFVSDAKIPESNLKGVVINKEQLLKDEISKIQPVSESYLGIQLFTGDPWISGDEGTAIRWTYPSSASEILHYKTYRDLWERGYYVTYGEKFGADYLAYPGDPLKFHAHFIVICCNKEIIINPKEIIAYGRLGQSVRKTVVLAYLNELNDICYQSIQWDGS